MANRIRAAMSSLGVFVHVALEHVYQSLKIFRQRRVEAYTLAALRMRKRQLRRVQRLALEVLQRLAQLRRGAFRESLASAVKRVADDGITHVLHVHADLVRAPGLEPHARQRVLTEAFLDAVVSHGFT